MRGRFKRKERQDFKEIIEEKEKWVKKKERGDGGRGRIGGKCRG